MPLVFLSVWCCLVPIYAQEPVNCHSGKRLHPLNTQNVTQTGDFSFFPFFFNFDLFFSLSFFGDRKFFFNTSNQTLENKTQFSQSTDPINFTRLHQFAWNFIPTEFYWIYKFSQQKFSFIFNLENYFFTNFLDGIFRWIDRRVRSLRAKSPISYDWS